ncbi:hypothetical protein ACJIZ3_023567 [Penstemon smallii]|uniref:RING-type E3 ubiquitin transferase n=1 Tax=Penstemon smallii TaxID=265156 RepID=A0ABD3TQT2_9LAMI
MAYVWRHQNPPQQPNQPITRYVPLTMFGTMPPMFVAQDDAHAHNTIPPFFIIPITTQQRYIEQERNLSFTHSHGVTRPRSSYDNIPTHVGRGGFTNVNSERQPNSSGGNLMASREDDTLLLSFVLDQSINQENPSPTDGLSESVIDRHLRTRDCNLARRNHNDDELCVVCQDVLCQENEKICILDCGHEFHQDCIRKWLLQRNFCPVCKATAIHLD